MALGLVELEAGQEDRAQIEKSFGLYYIAGTFVSNRGHSL